MHRVSYNSIQCNTSLSGYSSSARDTNTYPCNGANSHAVGGTRVTAHTTVGLSGDTFRRSQQELPGEVVNLIKKYHRRHQDQEQENDQEQEQEQEQEKRKQVFNFNISQLQESVHTNAPTICSEHQGGAACLPAFLSTKAAVMLSRFCLARKRRPYVLPEPSDRA